MEAPAGGGGVTNSGAVGPGEGNGEGASAVRMRASAGPPAGSVHNISGIISFLVQRYDCYLGTSLDSTAHHALPPLQTSMLYIRFLSENSNRKI